MVDRTLRLPSPLFGLRRAIRPHTASRRRLFRAGLTGVTTLAVRGATSLVALAAIPLLAGYLGNEGLGVWLLVATLLAWGGVADLGLTLSLTNAVATADGAKDHRAAAEAVSSVFFSLAALSAVVIVGAWLLQPVVPWDRVFNVSGDQARADVASVALVGMLFFAVRLLVGISGSVFAAYQEGYIYLLWTALGNFLGLCGLFAAVALHASLPVLVAVYYGGLLVGDIAADLHLMGKRRPYLRPRLTAVRIPAAVRLLRKGVAFWIATVSAILFLQIDLILITQLFGASTAAVYGTALKLATFIGSIQAAFIHPLWPSYSEALASKDVAWIRRIFAASIRLSIFWAVPVALLALVAGARVVDSMTQTTEPVDNLIIIALVLCEIANAVARCISTLLNGLGHLRSQLVFVPIGIVVNLGLSLVLAQRFGPAGVAFATCICLLTFWVGVMGRDAIKTVKALGA